MPESDSSASSSRPEAPPGAIVVNIPKEEMVGKPTLTQGFSTIRVNQFTFQAIWGMPCTKTACITGLAAFAIVGSSRMFATRMRMSSSFNYGMVALVASSAMSWQYCWMQKKIATEQLMILQSEMDRASNNPNASPPARNISAPEKKS